MIIVKIFRVPLKMMPKSSKEDHLEQIKHLRILMMIFGITFIMKVLFRWDKTLLSIQYNQILLSNYKNKRAHLFQKDKNNNNSQKRMTLMMYSNFGKKPKSMTSIHSNHNSKNLNISNSNRFLISIPINLQTSHNLLQEGLIKIKNLQYYLQMIKLN